jgi:hypothetical protein
MNKRYYLGLGATCREVFQSEETPTANAYPQYLAVIGPFRTRRGAVFMRDYGKGNPHCQCVADAERLALRVPNSTRRG